MCGVAGCVAVVAKVEPRFDVVPIRVHCTSVLSCRCSEHETIFEHNCSTNLDSQRQSEIAKAQMASRLPTARTKLLS